MIDGKIISHFNSIASTWQKKEWVHSKFLNRRIGFFVKSNERKIGLHKKKHKSMLYFGIGTGALFGNLAQYNIAGVDEAGEMLTQCPEGVVQILSKVENLPFLMDNQFNASFGRNLLKHCVYPEEAVISMYKKTRNEGTSMIAESVVLKEEDKFIPNELVRMADPNHPSFKTVDEILESFEKAGFKKINYTIIPHRSAWLKKWVEAEQVSKKIHKDILDLYKNAPIGFKTRYRVEINGDEITSTVPWLLVSAFKK